MHCLDAEKMQGKNNKKERKEPDIILQQTKPEPKNTKTLNSKILLTYFLHFPRFPEEPIKGQFPLVMLKNSQITRTNNQNIRKFHNKNSKIRDYSIAYLKILSLFRGINERI